MKKEKICGIYCIENLVNGKKYIGQSIDVRQRFYDHKSRLKNNRHRNPMLQLSWNKHGENNFKFYIITECDTDKLDFNERFYIQKYNTSNRRFGFNLDGGGNLNKVVSKETREKMSKNHYDINGENNPFYGKTHSQETLNQTKNNFGYLNRKIKGEDSHFSKLNKSQVIEIKIYLKNNKTTYKDEVLLAKKYNVGISAIQKIKHNRTWIHIIVTPEDYADALCTIKLK